MKRLVTVPPESLVLLYKTLIEPYFRYCNTVWGYCNETLLDKLQVLQNKVARVIKGSKFEYTNHPFLLKELCWLNVRQLIFIGTVILMYRVANNLAPKTISDMFQVANNVHNYNTRYASNGNFFSNRLNTAKGQRSTTVQAIHNITKFSCKKIHMNLYEFVWIRMNFVLKFVHEFVCKFVHEFMPEDYVLKEKIWGKVSVSLILYYVRSSSAEFYLHGQTLRDVDIIKGNILFEII